MAEARGDLTGSGPQQIWINVFRTGQDWNANRTDFRIQVRYEAKGFGSWANATQSWNANAGGHQWSGTFTIPSPGTSDIMLLDTGFSHFHDGEGHLGGFNNNANISTNHDRIGSGGVNVWEEAAPRIPQVPAAPSSMSVRAGTALPTSFGVDYTRGDNRGAGIEEDQIIWRRVSDGVDAWDDRNAAGYSNPQGIVQLIPGTAYDVFARSRNVRGWGNWAGPVRGETLSGGRAYWDNAWKNCRVRYWNGNAWQNCRVRAWNGTAWVNTR